ncbi:zinc finger protein 518A [Mesocricetus auratus]|uniref:Zinc finger protein 518A n=1 Tax=Mesocricetus auratus TaxID=10036 RepID=A0A1U7QAU6_MESAU|nr:zinc finger protein 518A [Mesocricetus auratus]XP_012972741.1 zinc finger protein 518A [Mesocricetus auratus]XP_021079568.1 zinc finger protein 518A [Mesocricetus auratus]XP_021079588.1 zinc finger protein 518A [Mesocricetus auratus]XP_021079638.1 zinc finger protein 518A [Mesocricetus auratus]
MPFEQTQPFCDEKQTILKKFDSRNEAADTIGSIPTPKISETSFHYELKNVNISLPKVNIPDEILKKHEVEKYRILFQSKPQTARKSISIKTVSCAEECVLPCKSERAEEESVNMSAKILNFSCLKCQDNTQYSPNDLQKHFEMWHHGELPSFPCEMCSFSANDFQIFKQHRKTHRNTFVKCDICNSERSYTLLDLTKHFTSNHCVNGNFQCEECRFFTQDVGTFVQHIHRHKEMHYKCGKCRHLCFTKGELQKHLRVHSGTLPFTCHYCSYGAIHKDQLVRHVITLHKEHLYAKEKGQYNKRVATTTGLKLILKRYKIGPTKTFWKRKTVTNGNDESIGKNTQVFNTVSKTQTKSEDQSQEQLNEEKGERLHCENGDKPTESEKSTLLSTGQCSKADERANAASSFLKSGVQGPTVLLVRNNKITIPANYSAKFMGFKVVDGRQHIVIKLLPISKQNLPAPALQPDKEKDSTANLPPQSLDNTEFATGVTTEVNDTDFVKAAPLSCSSPVLSKKETSEKEVTFVSEKNNMLQTVNNSKSSSSLPTTSESVTASVSLTTKVEATDNVDLWENDTTQSHPDVLGTTNIKSPDKVNLTTKPNAYSCGDMHNYCINYVSSELPDESSSNCEFSSQGSLPFHNYSKVNNKRRRFSRTAVFENLQRDSANKTITQESSSDSDTLSPPTRKESSDSDSLSASVSPLDDKDGTLKMKAEIEEPCNLEGQNFDKQSLFTNENQDLLSVPEETKWNESPSAGSPMMPRITSVFSLQSQQASEFLPPEVNQLLQDILKPKSDIKEDSNNIPSKNLLLDCDQTFKKAEEEEMIVESSKDLQVQDIVPGPSASVGVSVPTNDLSLKCNGQEKQVVSVLQDVRDSEVTAKIPSIITLLKTQSDAIITQQLVKDKLRTTTQNSGPVYIQNPFLTSEQKNPVFVQTPKGFIIPVHVANKPGFHVFSGRPHPLVNTQSVPASLLVNKKPGMLLTLNGKPEGVPTVKTENVQSYGTITTEPCKTSFLKVEQNSNCFTPTLCSSVGSCVNMKSCSENTLPLKGPYIIKTPVGSSVRTVHFPNILPEQQQGPKMTILGTGKQQNENLPKASLYTLMPDGKQAVFFKCMMPNNTELLKPKLVRNSPYQYIQPKRPEGAPQKILVKFFNPVLSVSAANNLSVSNSASSMQKGSVPSKLAGLGEQKEPESSRDALPVSNGLMPANEIVLTSTTTCPESSEEPVCISKHSETRVLRCKANCTTERNFSKRKTCKNKFAKIKTRISQDSEITIVSRNRSCKRKYIDNYQEPPRKKSTLHRKCREKTNLEDVQETFGFSRPRLSKDSGRILRLFPFNSKQLVKCPRRNQPVVVLNHPDADAPEVERVMKTIAKFNGRVLKVSLSQTTINALLKPVYYNTSETTYNDFSKRHRMLKPVNSVKERFVLKLTLKKTSKNNYRIVKTTSEDVLKAKFNCWFCGRVFDNQDAWAGHGQRHLVEATRDWNMLE